MKVPTAGLGGLQFGIDLDNSVALLDIMDRSPACRASRCDAATCRRLLRVPRRDVHAETPLDRPGRGQRWRQNGA